ncbi:MAG: beta-ketoacyl-ACP reductase [Bacillales bacterium]|jgi:3-oxoacyl-[acyl-carrier protein] reductase|nr:beta-ketoacyl-ACP reductase [Bacillales bacterium]
MLNGKIALVTGASRGIGRAIALEYGKNGATVIVNFLGNVEKANEVVSEIEALGGKAIAYKADVANSSEVSKMFDDITKEFGKIDILVNNAGITRDNLLIRMKDSEWDDVIQTNLTSVFMCSKIAAKHMMRNRSGRIINVSSVVGILGNPGQANYVAAKAGVIGLTKSMARELAVRGILVNAIAPGFIETDMTQKLNDDVRSQMQTQIPLQRFGTPEDIANVALFLATDQSSYITGQVISVDGGMAM